jgi:hypothetical protein
LNRNDWDELLAANRALIKAIAKNKPMTRNNARIIAKYLREAGWSEVTALRQELAAAKARVQEMGRHNATEAEHFRAICRRIDDWVSIMTTGHAPLSENERIEREFPPQS